MKTRLVLSRDVILWPQMESHIPHELSETSDQKDSVGFHLFSPQPQYFATLTIGPLPSTLSIYPAQPQTNPGTSSYRVPPHIHPFTASLPPLHPSSSQYKGHFFLPGIAGAGGTGE